MPDQTKPFVITDRRRHTLEGDIRSDTEPSPDRSAQPEPAARPQIHIQADPQSNPEIKSRVTSQPAHGGAEAAFPASGIYQAPDPHEEPLDEDTLPQAPSPEQMAQARIAYTQTAERLSLAVRAANPGVDHAPPMSFDGLVQSVYMTAIVQLGGATPEGQQPQVDLMAAQQSIAMLSILADKTQGNLSTEESALLDRALFELQVTFLEITQALARSAAARQQQSPTSTGFPPPPGGRPSIVR